jgi:transposase
MLRMDCTAEITSHPLSAAATEWLARLQQDAARSVQVEHELTQTTAELSHKAAALTEANLTIQALKLELARYKRLKFERASETCSLTQLTLFEETHHTDVAAMEAELAQASRLLDVPMARAPRQNAGRQALPDHLPRMAHLHEPASCTCAQCGGALVKIGEDISEQLDVEPARFFVHRHVRPKYACRACETMTAAPVPAAIIDGGLAAPGLLAWVVTNKYVDHLPLYRLEAMAARQGVNLARSTLAEWGEA